MDEAGTSHQLRLPAAAAAAAAAASSEDDYTTTPGSPETSSRTSSIDNKPASHGRDTKRTRRKREKYQDSESSEADSNRDRIKRYKSLDCVLIPGLSLAASSFEGYNPPLPVSSESDVLAELLSILQRTSRNDANSVESYTFFELDAFTIYESKTPSMISLDKLQRRRGHGYNEFRFDGILSVGNFRRYVQNVPFQIATIDGYGEHPINMQERVCIQTSLAKDAKVWYRLGKPDRVYERFHRPFLWLAIFTKLFLDYLAARSEEDSCVRLEDFRSQFFDFTSAQYADDHDFRTWHRIARYLKDFRTTVAAHEQYLWKECAGIDDNGTLSRHPIWGEIISDDLSAIPRQPSVEHQTIVTPFVQRCFQHMYFYDYLKEVVPQDTICNQMRTRKNLLGLTPFNAMPKCIPSRQGAILRVGYDHIEQGDIVYIYLTKAERSQWRRCSGYAFAYVQQVRETELDLLWLYQPWETTIGDAFYPYQNELFLTDNCACGRDAWPKAKVLATVDVQWHTVDPSYGGYFVRQKFRTCLEEDKHDFVSLKSSDLFCRCTQKPSYFEDHLHEYEIGDTVLLRKNSHANTACHLEPVEIAGLDHIKQMVLTRMLSRCGGRPNEVRITENILHVAATRIIRRCHVRSFISRLDVNFPYDQDGAGDFYYYIWNDTQEAPPITSQWRPSGEPLTGLGIFCGGGNLDRGLEEGGAVHFRYAVDWDSAALHSYRANLPLGHDAQFFLGSVNDYLATALLNNGSKQVADVGAVSLLSAGSPCPGFSTMQPNKQSKDAKRMASLVATTVSFVDLYSPTYVVFENVVTMGSCVGGFNDQNVFAQTISTLVGLGYQVQQFLVDSWSYGSCQRRSRLFIIASVPGVTPFQPPPHTHDHPSSFYTQKGILKQRCLGKASNECGFGYRRDDYTPFPHVSASIATSDLPTLSGPQICPGFPDHRIAGREGQLNNGRISCVPTRPEGLGLFQAFQLGRITCGEPFDYCARKQRSLEGSFKMKRLNSYARIYPDGLFPTVVTALTPQDAKNGRYVHWDQHRTISILESRRAQGHPDSEVLIGSTAQQARIVGNGVDRKVSFALGLGLNESWRASEQLITTRLRLESQETEAVVKTYRTCSYVVIRQSRPPHLLDLSDTSELSSSGTNSNQLLDPDDEEFSRMPDSSRTSDIELLALDEPEAFSESDTLSDDGTRLPSPVEVRLLKPSGRPATSEFDMPPTPPTNRGSVPKWTRLTQEGMTEIKKDGFRAILRHLDNGVRSRRTVLAAASVASVASVEEEHERDAYEHDNDESL